MNIDKEVRDVIHAAELFDFPEGDDDVRNDDEGDYSGVEDEISSKGSTPIKTHTNVRITDSPANLILPK